MHDAIYAQPGALRLVARGQGDAIEAAATRLRELDRVLLTGVGTSWHAALVGELLLARLGGLGHRARAFHAFELAGYWPEPERTGVIGVSHRGTNRDTLAALARGAGIERPMRPPNRIAATSPTIAAPRARSSPAW